MGSPHFNLGNKMIDIVREFLSDCERLEKEFSYKIDELEVNHTCGETYWFKACFTPSFDMDQDCFEYAFSINYSGNRSYSITFGGYSEGELSCLDREISRVKDSFRRKRQDMIKTIEHIDRVIGDTDEA